MILTFTLIAKKSNVIKSYYSNGKLKVSIEYYNGVKDGRYQSYYPNGKIEKSANYSDGKLDGYHRVYYTNGNLYSKVKYRNGLKSGTEKLYYHNGKKFIFTEYNRGIRDGNYKVYKNISKKTDAILLNGYYKDGYRDGSSQYKLTPHYNFEVLYSKNGSIKLLNSKYKGVKRDIIYKPINIKYKNKKLKYTTASIEYKFENMYKTILFIDQMLYYKNGKFKAEVPSYFGIYRLYYSNGKLKKEVPVGIVTYKSANLRVVKIGMLKEYYSNGVLKHQVLSTGYKLDGFERWYYPSGKLRAEILHGNSNTIKWYDKDGNEKKSITKKNYKRDGSLRRTVNYIDGVKNGYAYNNYKYISEKNFYIDGKLNGESIVYLKNKKRYIISNYYDNGKLDGYSFFYNDKNFNLNRLYIDGKEDGISTISRSYRYFNLYNYFFQLYGSSYLNMDEYKKSKYIDIESFIGLTYYPSKFIKSKKIFLNPYNHSKAKYLLSYYPSKKLHSKTIDFQSISNYILKKSYYENGNIQHIVSYKNNFINGYETFYYDNGKIKRDSQYIDGLPVGDEFFYTRNGVKKPMIFKELTFPYFKYPVKLTSYVDGKKNGFEKFYNPYNGHLTKVTHYIDDKKNGFEYFINASTGKIAFIDNYIDSKLTGDRKLYYDNYKYQKPISTKIKKSFDDNGTLLSKKSYLRRSSILFGTSYIYSKMGKVLNETFYIDDRKYGTKITYYKNGKIKSNIHFYANYKDGTSDEYHSDGKLFHRIIYYSGRYIKGSYFNKDYKVAREYYKNKRLKNEIFYKDQKRNGSTVKQNIDGSGVYIEYKNGKKDGKYIEWDSNGIEIIRSHYKNNRLNGEYQNIQSGIYINYKNGKKDGVFKKYDSRGILKTTGKFKDDKLILNSIKNISFNGNKKIKSELNYAIDAIKNNRRLKNLPPLNRVINRIEQNIMIKSRNNRL